jgi:arylsulfatase A-like enzyme
VNNFIKQMAFGCIAGGSLAAWYCLFEAICIYTAFPYQTDPATWSLMLLGYVAVGMVVGMVSTLFLVVLRRKRDPSAADFRVCLGVMSFSALAALISLMEAHLSLLANQLGWSPAVTVGILVPAGLLLYALLVIMSRSVFRRPLSLLCQPRLGLASLVFVALLAAGSWLLPVAPAELAASARMTAPSNSPNVVFVVLDTVRPDHLGSYGYGRDTSPRLDAFAAQGVLFENAFSTAPWTLPSHASMFTGVHVTTHKTGWENHVLPDSRSRIEGLAAYDFHTLAEELAYRGYQTVGIAKKPWLSYDHGLTQGFEQFHDYSIPTLLERLLGSRVKKRIQEKMGKQPDFSFPNAEDKGGARVIDTAISWLDGSRERDTSRPFFMFMNLNEAHDPYLPPQDVWERFLPESVAVADTVPDVLPATQAAMHQFVLGDLPLTADMILKYKALYDAEIYYQDQLLGRLFDALNEMGLEDNTLVIVVADHGEEFAEIGTRIGHQLSNVDTLLRVPLIMRYPPSMPAGQRVTNLASTVDLFPTILDFIEREQQLETPWLTSQRLSLEGVSQMDAMMPGGAPARDMVMAHYGNPTAYLSGWEEWAEHLGNPLEFPLAHNLRTIDVLRTADEKFFSYSDGSRAFVELSKDPMELGSESRSVAPELQARALMFERRLQQQLGSYLTLHEMLVGHMVNSRGYKATKRGGVSNQDAEQLGYVGESSGDGTEAESSLMLPPFLRIR